MEVVVGCYRARGLEDKYEETVVKAILQPRHTVVIFLACIDSGRLFFDSCMGWSPNEHHRGLWPYRTTMVVPLATTAWRLRRPA